MKKKYLALIAALAFCQIIQAQSIGPATINASGGGTVVNGNSFDYSIGEMTVVNTATTANNHYTQGVLQPAVITAESIDNILLSSQLLSVYPNPSHNILNIQTIDNTDAIASVQLYDALGKVVFSAKYDNKKSLQTIDMSAMANAYYTLQVSTVNNAPKLIYKISKN
jgi:hypothetical protein